MSLTEAVAFLKKTYLSYCSLTSFHALRNFFKELRKKSPFETSVLAVRRSKIKSGGAENKM